MYFSLYHCDMINSKIRNEKYTLILQNEELIQTYDCQNKICETQVLQLDYQLLQVQRRLSVGRRVS